MGHGLHKKCSRFRRNPTRILYIFRFEAPQSRSSILLARPSTRHTPSIVSQILIPARESRPVPAFRVCIHPAADLGPHHHQIGGHAKTSPRHAAVLTWVFASRHHGRQHLSLSRPAHSPERAVFHNSSFTPVQNRGKRLRDRGNPSRGARAPGVARAFFFSTPSRGAGVAPASTSPTSPSWGGCPTCPYLLISLSMNSAKFHLTSPHAPSHQSPQSQPARTRHTASPPSPSAHT